MSTTNTMPEQPVEKTGKPSITCIQPKDWSGEHKTYLLAKDN